MKPILEQAREQAAAKLSAGAMLTDKQAYTVPALFMLWNATASYTAGDRVRHGDLLYRCLQPHTAQADWTPDAAPSLWVRIDDPAKEWPEWRQPTGSTEAYALGAKVSHNNNHWVSAVSANVWEPGVYGWTEQS